MDLTIAPLTQVYVRYGSLADIEGRPRHVRFTPESGHHSRRGLDVSYVPIAEITPVLGR
jgi:hypothetical protein